MGIQIFLSDYTFSYYHTNLSYKHTTFSYIGIQPFLMGIQLITVQEFTTLMQCFLTPGGPKISHSYMSFVIPIQSTPIGIHSVVSDIYKIVIRTSLFFTSPQSVCSAVIELVKYLNLADGFIQVSKVPSGERGSFGFLIRSIWR